MIVPLSLTVMVAFGVMFYGFSVYLTDGAAGSEFSTTVLSVAYGGSALVAGLLALPVGHYADRRGVRGIVGTGAVLGFLGLAAFASAREPWQVMAAWWLLIGPAGAMTFYEPAFVAIDQWSRPGDRPRALATLTVIGGLAGVLFIPGTERLIAAVGWRPAVSILGLALLITGGATAAFAIPERSRGPGATPPAETASSSLRSLFRDRTFRLYTAAMMLSLFAAQGIVSHRVALFEESGFALATVAVWAAVASALSLPGRWAAPLAAHRYRATTLQAIATLMVGGAALLMIGNGPTWQMGGHFVLFGLAFGTLLPLRAMAMADWYSGPRYGRIMGVQWTAIALAGAAGPAVVGVLRDRTSGYGLPMTVLASIYLIVAALILACNTSLDRETEAAADPRYEDPARPRRGGTRRAGG